MDLNTIWYLLVGVLFTGYAILDGFDLGVGPLLLLAKSDEERRIFLNAIGPIWNGNEVWLVTGGGALFAAFPNVYATVFSGFYDAFMLLLFALIFRALAIEFRGQRPEAGWRRMWDFAFFIGSTASALLLGVAMGNIVWGLPLDANHDYHGGPFALLHPYALCVGLTTLALFVMHANLYLVLKTDGALQQKVMRWAYWTVPLYLVCFVTMNVVTLMIVPHIKAALATRWLLLGGAHVFAVLVTLNILREVRHGRDGRAFICSCISIVALMFQFGAAMFPNMVFSRPDLSNSLNIYNGASTSKSLTFMLYVAMIGVPIVLSYTATIYYVFRGKVALNEESY